MNCGLQLASLTIGDRIARWTRLSFEFAVSQGFAQAAGMISGLIYVHLMSVEQYALYAMGLTALTFLAMGSDLGLTAALGYFWRQRIKGSSAFEPKVAAVLRLRSIFLAAGAVVCGVLLLKTASTQKLSMAVVFACLGLVLVTAWVQTRTTVAILLIRLEGRQRQSYYCEGAGSIARLLAAGGMIVTGINTAIFGLTGGLLGALAILAAVRIMRRGTTNSAQPIRGESRREVLAFIIPMIPTMVVFMAQDPLVLWLAFTFGGAAPVSETFAVGRIAAMYAIIGSFTVIVVMPRLTSISDEAHLTRMVGLFLLMLAFLCVGAIMVAYLAPSALLLLIGPKYAHLHTEVVLAVASASFALLTSFVASVNRMRGWVRLEPVAATCQVVVILALAPHWSFLDSASVLRLMTILSGVNFLSFLVIGIVGVLAPSIVRVR
jgi:hypothetical protein